MKKKLWILLLTVAAVVAIMLLTAYSGGKATPVADGAQKLTAPFRAVVNGVSQKVTDVLAYISKFDDLKAENASLKAEMLEQQELLRRAEDLEAENEELRKILNLWEPEEEYALTSADVVARGDGEYTKMLTINRGSAADISVGDACYVAEGLVGIVCEVGTTWAHILTITDSATSFGGSIYRTKIPAVCAGSYALMQDGFLKLTDMAMDCDVRVGDVIVTSGLAGNLPEGIPVGTVSRIYQNSEGTGREAIITPAVDTDSLREVFVITSFQGEME